MPKATSLSRTVFIKVIHELMSRGHPGIEHAARKFDIPVRTLQRQLYDAGISYSELVDEVRYTAACCMLKSTQMCMADIANALGFSNASNFSRAFRRWTGMSPSTYRVEQSRVNSDLIPLRLDSVNSI